MANDKYNRYAKYIAEQQARTTRSKKSEAEKLDEVAKKTFKVTTGQYTDTIKAHSDRSARLKQINNVSKNAGVKPKDYWIIRKMIKGTGTKTTYTREETEQVDELAKSTLGSYVRKSAGSAQATMLRSTNQKHADNEKQGVYRKIRNRNKGIGQAVSRLTREGIDALSADEALHLEIIAIGEQLIEAMIADGLSVEEMTEVIESTEQLNELSKKTLGSYIKKAVTSVADHSAKAETAHNTMTRWSNWGYDDVASKARKQEDKHRGKIENRIKGVQRAASRLTKEETQQLDETATTLDHCAKHHADALASVEALEHHLKRHQAAAGDRADVDSYQVSKIKDLASQLDNLAMRAGEDADFEEGSRKDRDRVKLYAQQMKVNK